MYSRHNRIYSFLILAACLTFFSSAAKPGPEKKKWVVVIDAGHGGKDPGCHGKRYKEKDVALAVALKLGHYIEQNNNDVKVIYTRKTDTFVALNERAEIANRNHADLFLCIHCNANTNTDASGAATYVMGLSKSNGNLEVSKRENASILFEKDYKQTYDGFDPNSGEATVLFAMYQNIYLQESLSLSTMIQSQYSKRINRTDNGVKQAGFLVLWRTAMPSLLTEIGFLTNREEEKKIGSQKGEDQIAEAIFFAFEQYKADKDKANFNPKSFNLMPLALKNISDTTESDSISAPDKNVAKVDSDENSGSPVVKKDSVPEKKMVKNPDKELKLVKKVEKEKVKNDTVPTAVKNMREAVNHPKHDSVLVAKKQKADTVKKLVVADTANQLIYKVQFFVSPTPVSLQDKRFAGLQTVEMYQEGTTCKYTSGHYCTPKDAIDSQANMRKNGWKDAFVVTFRNGKRVNTTKLSSK